MRRAALAALLLAAACGGPADPPARQTDGAAAPAPGEPDDRIECRVAGAARFERICSVQSEAGPRGRVLTLRKADGGFRRLLVTRDGRGLAAADGAERPVVVPHGPADVEVEIGGDRFRLPASAVGQ